MQQVEISCNPFDSVFVITQQFSLLVILAPETLPYALLIPLIGF